MRISGILQPLNLYEPDVVGLGRVLLGECVVTELHFSQERMLRIAFMMGSGTGSAPSNLTYRFSEVEILDLSLVTSQIPTLLPVAPLMVETFLYDERSRVCELGLDDVYIYFTATALDVTIGPMDR